WLYAPGLGWGWQPGAFNGWRGGVHYMGAVAGFRAPVEPTGTAGTVVVGRGGPVLKESPATSLLVSRGSAGMGIPRGSVEGLRHLNAQVAKTGFAKIRSAPQFAASSFRSSGFVAGEPHAAVNGGVGHVGAPSAGHASAASAGGHR
ncbi:MAG: hypothetical protein WA261_07920, partial [Candidatus Sulfotelmatobacter sp.]